MNNTFFSEEISRTGKLDPNLILRQYKLKLIARFMENYYVNPKLKQSQKAKELN